MSCRSDPRGARRRIGTVVIVAAGIVTGCSAASDDRRSAWPTIDARLDQLAAVIPQDASATAFEPCVPSDERTCWQRAGRRIAALRPGLVDRGFTEPLPTILAACAATITPACDPTKIDWYINSMAARAGPLPPLHADIFPADPAREQKLAAIGAVVAGLVIFIFMLWWRRGRADDDSPDVAIIPPPDSSAVAGATVPDANERLAVAVNREAVREDRVAPQGQAPDTTVAPLAAPRAAANQRPKSPDVAPAAWQAAPRERPVAPDVAPPSTSVDPVAVWLEALGASAPDSAGIAAKVRGDTGVARVAAAIYRAAYELPDGFAADGAAAATAAMIAAVAGPGIASIWPVAGTPFDPVRHSNLGGEGAMVATLVQPGFDHAGSITRATVLTR